MPLLHDLAPQCPRSMQKPGHDPVNYVMALHAGAMAHRICCKTKKPFLRCSARGEKKYLNIRFQFVKGQALKLNFSSFSKAKTQVKHMSTPRFQSNSKGYANQIYPQNSIIQAIVPQYPSFIITNHSNIIRSSFFRSNANKRKFSQLSIVKPNIPVSIFPQPSSITYFKSIFLSSRRPPNGDCGMVVGLSQVTEAWMAFSMGKNKCYPVLLSSLPLPSILKYR